MSDKPFAFIFAMPAMVACCVGIPLLLGRLMNVGLIAWLAAATFVVVVVIAVAVASVHLMDRRKRRHLGARHERAVVAFALMTVAAYGLMLVIGSMAASSTARAQTPAVVELGSPAPDMAFTREYDVSPHVSMDKILAFDASVQ